MSTNPTIPTAQCPSCLALRAARVPLLDIEDITQGNGASKPWLRPQCRGFGSVSQK